MKHITIVSAATLILGAHAGFAVAGPTAAGTSAGSSVSGEFIIPQALSDALVQTPIPGKVGRILINNDQARAIAAYLKEQAGGTTVGSVTTAPTTFADGTDGTISIDTDKNVLTLSRG